MRSHHPLVIAALAFLGCASVKVESNSRANDPDALVEPIAFVIFQSSTPLSYSKHLQSGLSNEMKARDISARFTIVLGSENDKGRVVAKALSEVSGCIIIAPSNVSPLINVIVVPAYYDVRALQILQHPGTAVPGSGPNGATPISDGKGRVATIWRGRVSARGGFAEENFRDVASQLVEKLIADHVLRGTSPHLPPKTPHGTADGVIDLETSNKPRSGEEIDGMPNGEQRLEPVPDE